MSATQFSPWIKIDRDAYAPYEQQIRGFTVQVTPPPYLSPTHIRLGYDGDRYAVYQFAYEAPPTERMVPTKPQPIVPSASIQGQLQELLGEQTGRVFELRVFFAQRPVFNSVQGKDSNEMASSLQAALNQLANIAAQRNSNKALEQHFANTKNVAVRQTPNLVSSLASSLVRG